MLDVLCGTSRKLSTSISWRGEIVGHLDLHYRISACRGRPYDRMMQPRESMLILLIL